MVCDVDAQVAEVAERLRVLVVWSRLDLSLRKLVDLLQVSLDAGDSGVRVKAQAATVRIVHVDESRQFGCCWHRDVGSRPSLGACRLWLRWWWWRRDCSWYGKVCCS